MKDWDLDKKKAFTKSMKRQNFSKGGLIRKLGNRKYFDDGGKVTEQSLTSLAPAGTSGVVQNASNPNTGILGTVGGLLGLNNNFQASGANVQQGTNQAQLNQGYAGAQNALTGQENLTNTLSPQASGAVANQNALAQQLYGMTQGQGPNPAQAELAQATNANIANQAALMAGQRGSSANAGLLARQAAQQGAQQQQQAIGQAATLQAQQQIAAQQNLANLAGTQIGQVGQAVQGLNTAQQNEQNILQGANTAANNAAVGMQSNINSTNAATAGANQGMAGKLLGGIGSAVSAIPGALSGIGAALGLAEGGVVGQDGQEMAEHLKLAEMNAHAIAHGRKNYGGGGQIVGNPLLGNQTLSQNPAINYSSQYTPMSSSAGPNISGAPTIPQFEDYQGPEKSKKKKDTESMGIAGDWESGSSMAGGGDNGNVSDSVNSNGPSEMLAAYGGRISHGPHGSHVANYLFAEGGKVPAMVSPGEIYLSPDKVHRVIHEGVDPAKIGHKFKGKAKVKGDSLKNDTIPTDLEAGGVVIDRKNMSTREKRELFVHRAIARKKARK